MHLPGPALESLETFGLALVAPPPTRAQSCTSKPATPIFVLPSILGCVPLRLRTFLYTCHRGALVKGFFLVLHGRGVFCRGIIMIHCAIISLNEAVSLELLMTSALTFIATISSSGRVYIFQQHAHLFPFFFLFLRIPAHISGAPPRASGVVLGRHHVIEVPLLHLAIHRLFCATGIHRGAS